MNLTPLGQMIVWFGKAHQEGLKLVEGLSDEQLAWQPHPSATSIAFNVWHLARWTDYLQSQIPKTTPVLSQRLKPRQQVWHAENLARKWGLDPTSLGENEAGNELGVLAALIHFPGKEVLLEYLQHCYTLEEEALAALDDQQFQERRTDGAGPPDQTVGYWVMWYLVHEWEHLGMMRYLQGLYDLHGKPISSGV
ncbi:MAG TPA: DinB family protein [Anaerolineales bacterium]